ncbi:MAG: TolC family protein [Parachlamydiaceae bacterium]|nr:TolC family protein [Parachlamydiaceae bacterium]
MLSIFRQKKIQTCVLLCLAFTNLGMCDELCADLSVILNFEEAYNYALLNNIKTMATEVDADIRQAERRQVGLYPNPEFNISLDGPSNGTSWNSSGNDISIGITQLFELGGKRKARIHVAEAAQDETNWSLEIAKCDLYAEVMHAFVNTAVAQERLILAKDFQEIAEQSLNCITCKTSCGKAPLLDTKKAEISLKMAKIIFNKRLSELQRTKIQLSSLWNSNEPQFERVEFKLFAIEPPLPYHQLAEEIENNPELARAHAEVSKAWKIIKLEHAKRIPNMAIYVGVSTSRNFHDPALSLAVNIPLPIFDRNQGNIERADFELNQVMLKQVDLINKLKVRLKVVYREWNTAYLQVADLKEIIETSATDAFKLAEERYAIGNSSFLDFLDARATLFMIRQQYLDAVEEYHHKQTEIIQLLAKCCSEVING